MNANDNATKQILAAAKKGDFDALQSLWGADHGATLAQVFEKAVTDFRTVSRNADHAEILKWCIDEGFNPLQRVGWMKQPAICIASMHGNSLVVDHVLARQPESAKDPFVAASVARIGVLESMAGELSQLRDVNEFNLLHYAAGSGLGRFDDQQRAKQREVCEFLIDQNVPTDVVVRNEIELTPALLCVWFSGDPAIMQMLIDAGEIDVSTLHQAVEFAFEPHQRSGDPHVECAEVILQSGFDLNSIRNDQGRTLLHGCANRGAVAAVNWLLENGANPNALDADGRTSLHSAAERNSHGAVASLLLAAGVDRDLTDVNGRTALEVAQANRRQTVVKTLAAEGGEKTG